MDRPFVLELQCLLSRLKQGLILCSNDVDVLDRAFTGQQNTEIANSLNEAFAILDRNPPQNFFPSFDAINTHAQCNNTRLFAHTVLSGRIKNQWATFDITVRDCLKVFVVNGIESCLSGTNRHLLQSYNNSLVSILRFEWGSLLRQFVDSLQELGLNTSPQKIVNNLTILQLLLEEGAGFQEEQYFQEEVQSFRQAMDHSMRTILKYVCLCLHNEGEERATRIKRTLEMIQHSIEFIPAFELFNCNLIETLVGLIGERDFKDALTACFQQIFRFRQVGTNGNSHAKIAKKLLLILESYISVFEHSQKERFPQDYDTASTEDSFQSRTTRRKNITKNESYTDLMYLLYEFLVRYVPYMDKAKGEGDLELQFSGNLKLYFSQDLYNAFGMIYWRLMRFMLKVMDRFDPFLMAELNEQLLEESRKVVVCLKLLIAMQGKLKLESREETSALIENAVLCFTTLPQEFQRYYLEFRMIINGGEIVQEMPPFSSEFEEDYKDLIRQILAQKDVSQRFFNVLQTNINQTLKEFISQMNKNKPKETNTNLQLLNTLNRVCWSSVYAHNINQDLTQGHKYHKIQKDLFRCLQRDTSQYILINKFISVSCRYLSQIYSDHQRSVKTAIMPTLQSGINDNSVEFALLILGKVLHSPKLQPHFSYEDIQLIIDRLRSLQKMNPNDDSLLPMYPGMIHLFMRIDEIPAKNRAEGKLKDMMADLMDRQLTELQGFSKNNYVNDHPQLQRTILYFRKLIEISNYLKDHPHYGFASWLQTKLYTTIQMFHFKDCLYSLQLGKTEKENFDIMHMVKFKQYYLQMLREMASISTALPALGDMDAKKKARHVQRVKKLVEMQNAMRADFVTQKYFKNKEYFGFASEFYKLITANSIRDRVEIVNQSISEVMQSLRDWCEDGEIVTSKYTFWKEVVKSHLFVLSLRNKEHLLHLLAEFQMVTTQATQLEIILEVFESFVKSLYEQCVKNSKPIPAEFIELFLKTFELLFSNHCKNKAIFDRLAALILSYVEFACTVPFCFHPRKDNIDVLYIALQNHIMGQLGVEFDQEHCCRVQSLLHQRGRWFLEIRDYVVYLNRVLRAMGK